MHNDACSPIYRLFLGPEKALPTASPTIVNYAVINTNSKGRPMRANFHLSVARVVHANMDGDLMLQKLRLKEQMFLYNARVIQCILLSMHASARFSRLQT
jgi:hypothetical protein